MTDEEYANWKTEQDNAPACGACMLLVSSIRRDAAAILLKSPSVYPETPREAWASLQGTRWERSWDIAAFVDSPDADDARFDALTLAVATEHVQELVDERQEARRVLEEQRSNYRSEQLSD